VPRGAAADLEHLALAWARHNRCRIRLGAPPPAADPTRGATRYHRHDRFPGWARLAEPVALIGGFVFYRV
jgi:hypothetical protein